jgi:hypothetical protein
MICVAEKKSHLPHEVAFGGAIPKHLAEEFKALVADAGWSHKRALAAAVMVFLREAKSKHRLQDTQAVQWYHEVGAVAKEGANSGGESGATPQPPSRAGKLQNLSTKALADVRGKSASKTEAKP